MEERCYISNINQPKTIKSTYDLEIYQNLNYMINSSLGSTLFLENEVISYRERILYVVDYMLKLNLSNLDAYLNSVKIIFNYKYNIPVYINDKIILISIRNIKDYNNIWINYINIEKSVSINNKTNIIFKNGEKLEINRSISYLKGQEDKIINIKNYLNKLNYW
ncbi:competence protein ComK [Haploplasma modicum]|uniref:competence protein ComK n=1 Tax=Haploplasma modicum TaxID=2150 RepID=UPI00047B4C9C|nr:competence protein ComK [Haploplasma modicum]